MATIVLHPVCFPNIATLTTAIQHQGIWEAQDNFQKQTYRNRYHICTDQGKHTLTIPIQHIKKNEGRQKYSEVKIDNKEQWQRQHWRTLQTAYRTSPFFEFYEDELAPLFTKDYTYLIDFNFDTLRFFEDALSINLGFPKTETYHKTIEGHQDGRFLVNAKQQFPFNAPKYNQVFMDRHAFIPNTSALDLLFNEGPYTLSLLKEVDLSFLHA
ncbi:WbqC family protein [Flavobacterium sp. ASW18X]|uniref:WbqC family protein n=1 Tax=Flavobacterium sp. ASW18X TaxID=2572595 RepID=UPI0010AE7D26|nr:WbqC family protein [Flavobacterium sp. ASW18X]TKD62477.1 hypothetical protein FBT53_09580 [Flavobacterium sp. ASW18X]